MGGADVLATDADVASADLVIAQNQEALGSSGGSIATACLRWGSDVPDKAWAAILVSDALYDEGGYAPLAATLSSGLHAADKAQAATTPRVLMTFQRRRPEVESLFLVSTFQMWDWEADMCLW